MRYWIIVCLIIGCFSEGFAQNKYWILFQDKGDMNTLCPEEVLSTSSLLRRERQEIPFDVHDYPIYGPYLDSLKSLAITPIIRSRWLNGVSARLTRFQLDELGKKTFVRQIVPVATSLFSQTRREAQGLKQMESDYKTQLTMLGLDALHAGGFTGKGVTIAILDNGFLAVDTLSAFAHLYERNGVVGTRDFVENDADAIGPCRGSCKHGTGVLSLLAARVPGGLIGAAPDADYLLIRTENDTAELRQEEDAWLAGAEWADSMGADVIVSSLNYRKFDIGQGSYSSADFDGNTALVTIAADIAASKGITVVVSAGNGGSGGIDAPADGDSVIAVGAVDDMRNYSNFSGVGPSADGRVKPDVAAMGELTYRLTTQGEVRQGNGTSYACPLIAGLAACLLQASEGIASNSALYDALIRSADHFSQPNNEVGYGIPNGIEAFSLLTGRTLSPFPSLSAHQIRIYSDLTTGEINIAIQNERDAFTLTTTLVDMLGRSLFTQQHTIPPGFHRLTLSPSINRGIYTLNLLETGGLSLISQKVMIH